MQYFRAFITALVFASFIVSISAVSVLARENDKPSFLVIIKNDYVQPNKKGAPGYYANTNNLYAKYGWLGIGMDATFSPKTNYLNVKPFMTLNKGPFSLLAGYSALNSGQCYMQTGIWYVNTHNKFFMIFDLRNLWSVDQRKSPSYLDFFVHITHPVGKYFYAGIEAEYIHWWDRPAHNWFFAGPVVGLKITKNVSVYARFAREFDIKTVRTETTDRYRIGIKMTF